MGTGRFFIQDKAGLDSFWLTDESLEDSDNLPDPDVLSREIVDDLEAAREQFHQILADLGSELIALKCQSVQSLDFCAITPFDFFVAMYFFIVRRRSLRLRLCRFFRASCFMLILLVRRDKPAVSLRMGILYG
jgi:hypothetical protein